MPFKLHNKLSTSFASFADLTAMFLTAKNVDGSCFAEFVLIIFSRLSLSQTDFVELQLDVVESSVHGWHSCTISYCTVQTVT